MNVFFTGLVPRTNLLPDHMGNVLVWVKGSWEGRATVAVTYMDLSHGWSKLLLCRLLTYTCADLNTHYYQPKISWFMFCFGLTCYDQRETWLKGGNEQKSLRGCSSRNNWMRTDVLVSSMSCCLNQQIYLAVQLYLGYSTAITIIKTWHSQPQHIWHEQILWSCWVVASLWTAVEPQGTSEFL